MWHASNIKEEIKVMNEFFKRTTGIDAGQLDDHVE